MESPSPALCFIGSQLTLSPFNEVFTIATFDDIKKVDIAPTINDVHTRLENDQKIIIMRPATVLAV